MRLPLSVVLQHLHWPQYQTTHLPKLAELEDVYPVHLRRPSFTLCYLVLWRRISKRPVKDTDKQTSSSPRGQNKIARLCWEGSQKLPQVAKVRRKYQEVLCQGCDAWWAKFELVGAAVSQNDNIPFHHPNIYLALYAMSISMVAVDKAGFYLN